MSNKDMKKTFKDLHENLLTFFGLKVGYKIKLVDTGKVAIVKENYLRFEGYGTDFFNLIDKEYEIITTKKVGELKCRSILCELCPLRMFDCDFDDDKTLNELWNKIKEDKYVDQEIFDLIDKRLEKEVECL